MLSHGNELFVIFNKKFEKRWFHTKLKLSFVRLYKYIAIIYHL